MRILLVGGCGYVGSALFAHLAKAGHQVDSIDLEMRGRGGVIRNNRRDYRALADSFFGRHDAAVWVAGHSTVAQCVAEPSQAFDNNVTGLLQFAKKLPGIPLIYASSGSVYDAADNAKFRNMYDLSKFTADEAMQFVYPNFYALRFGTVCGPSPNMRWDTMLNSMVKSAVERRNNIEVWNPEARRPLLGISDLCRAVEVVLTKKGDPGIYNLASCLTTVGELADKVATLCGAAITKRDGPVGYDFTMSTEKFQQVFGFKFESTIEGMIASVRLHLTRAA